MNKLSSENFNHYQIPEQFEAFKTNHQELLEFIDDEKSVFASIGMFFKRLGHSISAAFQSGDMPLWLNNKNIIQILNEELDILDDQMPNTAQKVDAFGKEKLVPSDKQKTIQDVLLAISRQVRDRLQNLSYIQDDQQFQQLNDYFLDRSMQPLDTNIGKAQAVIGQLGIQTQSLRRQRADGSTVDSQDREEWDEWDSDDDSDDGLDDELGINSATIPAEITTAGSNKKTEQIDISKKIEQVTREADELCKEAERLVDYMHKSVRSPEMAEQVERALERIQQRHEMVLQEGLQSIDTRLQALDARLTEIKDASISSVGPQDMAKAEAKSIKVEKEIIGAKTEILTINRERFQIPIRNFHYIQGLYKLTGSDGYPRDKDFTLRDLEVWLLGPLSPQAAAKIKDACDQIAEQQKDIQAQMGEIRKKATDLGDETSTVKEESELVPIEQELKKLEQSWEILQRNYQLRETAVLKELEKALRAPTPSSQMLNKDQEDLERSSLKAKYLSLTNDVPTVIGRLAWAKEAIDSMHTSFDLPKRVAEAKETAKVWEVRRELSRRATVIAEDADKIQKYDVGTGEPLEGSYLIFSLSDKTNKTNYPGIPGAADEYGRYFSLRLKVGLLIATEDEVAEMMQLLKKGLLDRREVTTGWVWNRQTIAPHPEQLEAFLKKHKLTRELPPEGPDPVP